MLMVRGLPNTSFADAKMRDTGNSPNLNHANQVSIRAALFRCEAWRGGASITAWMLGDTTADPPGMWFSTVEE